jgi:hypothetical protein
MLMLAGSTGLFRERDHTKAKSNAMAVGLISLRGVMRRYCRFNDFVIIGPPIRE